MKEADYKQNISAYLQRLDQTQRDNFAPLDVMIENSLKGADLQILTLRNQEEPSTPATIHGLVILNQEPHSSKSVSGMMNVKIEIQHFSTIDLANREQMFDFVLEHIWKLSHCSSIKFNLHH